MHACVRACVRGVRARVHVHQAVSGVMAIALIGVIPPDDLGWTLGDPKAADNGAAFRHV